MSYDIIVSVPDDLKPNYEKWTQSLVDSNIPFKFSQPFDIEKHEGGMLAEYRGEEVEFEYYCEYKDLQMRLFITFCTDGEEESIAAAKAAALGISLVAASKGVISDPQTGEKIKGPRALGKLLKELSAGLDEAKAGVLIKKEYLPCADIASFIYDAHLKEMGFKYYKKNKRNTCLIKEYEHFIHGVYISERRMDSISFSLRVEAFVSFDNMCEAMGIDRGDGMSMSINKSVRSFPYPENKDRRWGHQIFEADTEVIDTYKKRLVELIEWFKEVDTLEKLAEYPFNMKSSAWPWLYKGRIFELLEQSDEAIDHYKGCIKKCEEDRRWPSLEWLARVHNAATQQLKALS